MQSHRFVTATLTTVFVLVFPATSAATPLVATHTWHVKADSLAGNGSAGQPFNALAQVQNASQVGDTIVVEPSARPLNGGIALKKNQKLIGSGPAVTKAMPGQALPRLINTNLAAGDAITLASGVKVRNLAIAGTRRSGIYGHDATDVTIEGNDISGSNQSCVDGFIIGPFQIPASIAVRRAVPKLPNYVTLNNGWAAVMLDYPNSAGTVEVSDNVIHDTSCGDGLDIRTFGTSSIAANVDNNVLHHINVGVAKFSVLAIGLQSKDKSSLSATLTRNTETHIADPAASPLNKIADSEGLFINPVDRSHMRVNVDQNHYNHGDGNFSANGLEYVTTTGSPTSEVRVTNSRFDDVPGDVIESYNLSPDAAHHSLALDNVRASRSHFPAAVLNPIIPTNLGSCLVTTGFGRRSTTELMVRNSSLHDCSADGLGVISYVPEGSDPATARMKFDIRNTSIRGAAANGINVVNVGALTQLSGRVENTTIFGGRQSLIRTANDGKIDDAVLDFGGGSLGSRGANCIDTTVPGALKLAGTLVTAHSNWWDTPAGPPPTSTLDAAHPLNAPPRPGC